MSAAGDRGGGHHMSPGGRHQGQEEAGDQAAAGGDDHDQGLLEIKTGLRKSLAAGAALFVI